MIKIFFISLQPSGNGTPTTEAVGKPAMVSGKRRIQGESGNTCTRVALPPTFKNL